MWSMYTNENLNEKKLCKNINVVYIYKSLFLPLITYFIRFLLLHQIKSNKQNNLYMYINYKYDVHAVFHFIIGGSNYY